MMAAATSRLMEGLRAIPRCRPASARPWAVAGRPATATDTGGFGVVTTVAALVLATSSPVSAQSLHDHLACYKVKDPLKESAVVDLAAAEIFGQEDGCRVKVAGAELCMPAEKTLQSYTGSPVAQGGQDLANGFLCYKAKCPKLPTPGVVATDRFGTRDLVKPKAQKLCAPAAVTVKRVFVTSSTFGGDFGGIAVADATCQTAADNAGLDGTFVAWLSDSQKDARDVLPKDSAWANLAGDLIAYNLKDLTDGELLAPITYDENGTDVGGGGSANAWTGTFTDGKGSGTGIQHCGDWQSTVGNGAVGRAYQTNMGWTIEVQISCTGSWRLYCFET